MNNPKVSIIIATYNSGATLRAALKSVLNQKYQDWECIVVDGASKDNTIAIVREYESKDSRFKHISEKDNGIYDAFNKGWRLAKGEWIHYLGSDDELTEVGFSELNLASIPNDVAVVTGDVYLRYKSGKLKPQLSIEHLGCHQGKLTRRSIIEKLGGFDETFRIVADAEMCQHLKSSGYKILNIRSFIAYFYLGGTSQDFKHLYQYFKENYIILKRYKARRFPLLYITYRYIFTLLSRLRNKTR